MVLDMFCHWNYVLENLFGRVEAVTAKAVTHIPERWDEQGNAYAATADDAAYGDLRARRRRSSPRSTPPGPCASTASELVEFQVDGTHGSAVAGLLRLPHPAARATPEAGLEPRPADRPGLPRPVARGPRQRRVRATASSAQWEQFLRDVDARTAARLRLRAPAPAASSWPRPGSQSSAEGRRVELGDLALLTATVASIPLADATAAARGRRSGRRAPGPSTREPFETRVAFAAAHVVADPRGENVPGAPAVIDWDATLAFRRHLFRYGLGVAEAMDTAQRNMGLDWPATQELITPQRRRGTRAPAPGSPSGAGTDHLTSAPATVERGDSTPTSSRSTFVEGAGSQVDRDGLAPPRRRRHRRRGLPGGLRRRCLRQVREPVVLHWLGEAFDPQLRGLLGIDRHRDRHRRPSSTSSASTPTRSTGSRCRCSSPSTRSRCGRRCPTGSGSTPATTSTTPS